jgi:hypothetical protein
MALSPRIGDEVAGEACDRHLQEADDPAIARQEHQAERDHPEDGRVAEDLDEPERGGDERHHEEDCRDDPERRPKPDHGVGRGAVLPGGDAQR